MSGKEALEKSKTGTYDVVLLDVMLGDMSGLDVLKIWRGPNHPFRTTPVFLSTNRGEDTIVKQGFALGMEGYFYKSQYVPEDLVKEINIFFSKQEGETPAGVTNPPPAPADTPANPPAPVKPLAPVPIISDPIAPPSPAPSPPVAPPPTASSPAAAGPVAPPPSVPPAAPVVPAAANAAPPVPEATPPPAAVSASPGTPTQSLPVQNPSPAAPAVGSQMSSVPNPAGLPTASSRVHRDIV